MLIDTRASISLIESGLFDRISTQENDIEVIPYRETSIKTAGGQLIPIREQTKIYVNLTDDLRFMIDVTRVNKLVKKLIMGIDTLNKLDAIFK